MMPLVVEQIRVNCPIGGKTFDVPISSHNTDDPNFAIITLLKRCNNCQAVAPSHNPNDQGRLVIDYFDSSDSHCDFAVSRN